MSLIRRDFVVARPWASALLLCALPALGGCGPKVRYADDIDVRFDLGQSERFDDKLSAPYVAGSRFNIYVYDRAERTALGGWELRTDAPDVLVVEDQFIDEEDIDEDDRRSTRADVIVAGVYAASAGAVVLEVYDDSGDYVRGVEVEIAQPDNFILRPAGPLFVRDEERVSTELDDSPQLLADGVATFEVEWYRGEERLYGAGALSVSSDSESITDAWARENVLDEEREWVTLTTAPASGDTQAEVEFRASGEVIGTVTFDVLGADDVDHLELVGQSESGRDDGDKLVVLAQAVDILGETIWGTAFDWDLDGAGEPGEGDLFRYKFERSRWSVLGAGFNGQRVEMDVQGVEGVVDSTTSSTGSCFCSIGDEHDEQAPARGLLFGLAALAPLALVRRRRRA